MKAFVLVFSGGHVCCAPWDPCFEIALAVLSGYPEIQKLILFFMIEESKDFAVYIMSSSKSHLPAVAGTMQTDPRSGGLKRSSGVNVLQSVADAWAEVRDDSNLEVDWILIG